MNLNNEQDEDLSDTVAPSMNNSKAIIQQFLNNNSNKTKTYQLFTSVNNAPNNDTHFGSSNKPRQ